MSSMGRPRLDQRPFLEEHLAEIRTAARRVAPHIRRTPVLDASELRRGAVVKPELLQPTGSFKVRGAFNALLALRERDPSVPGVVTGSSGNHGQAVALAARTLGMRCVVVMPEGANPVKVAGVRRLGADVVTDGVTMQNRDARVAAAAESGGLHVIHAFDAWDTIHGQATAALELLEDLPDLGLVVTPVGGGGLLAGTALAVRALRPDVVVAGVEPEVAGDAAAAWRTGEPQRLPQTPATIADGLRPLALGERTFDVIVRRRLVDAVVTVSEAEIESAVVAAWTRLHLVVEPSAAVTLAALLAGRLPQPAAGGRSALVLTGGNVDPALVVRLLGG